MQVNHNRFLGYTKDEVGHLIIEPAEAKVVKRIYREYLEGASLLQIGRGLEADGILTGAVKDFGIQSLSLQLFCKLHEVVMKDAVWGTSGRIRTQIFLMHPYFHADMEDYNPPLPERLNDLLKDLIAFSKPEGKTDILIKAALIYYQFETIHPFECGNGLIGRLLPNMILMKEKVLSRPILPLSNYYYQNEEECERQFTIFKKSLEYAQFLCYLSSR